MWIFVSLNWVLRLDLIFFGEKGQNATFLFKPDALMMSAKLIYVLSSFHMIFCAFGIHIHVKLIKFPLNLVL